MRAAIVLLFAVAAVGIAVKAYHNAAHDAAKHEQMRGF